MPLDHGLDPGGRERRRLNAEAGIDHDQALGQQLREMLGLAIRPREADARGLRDVIDAQEDEIEPPRADAARFEIEAQLVGKLSDDALQILGIADRFGKTQFGARHFGRHKRRQRFIGIAERLIEPQQDFAAEARAQTAARLARELRHALDADFAQRCDGCGRKPKAATGRLAIASDARPGETICASP